MPLLDPPLTLPPKLKLSRLRNIGWSVWDPIELVGADQKWNDEGCLPFADEYDGYLVQAAGLLRRGEAASDVAGYLAEIELEHMGLGGHSCLWPDVHALRCSFPDAAFRHIVQHFC